ncbi:phage antirepressor KilAC domain-containing protein [uncultured Senegalimassilia sp.]|jgi:anti-repressor protein|uniref:phage antirepressor n=1 Tax=uncultured Senegalimassilia sp. TaxID=1714350 RepID=UPI00206080E3|nr:phage antirepressor KilAC domain-containing protein [uncultured Senegalimassilia sp.]DAM01148.1 MAG TPA: repressor domain protein [Caudoviricetes sp.]
MQPNEIVSFDNPEFGRVRVLEQEGEPWFVAKDVATILGYKNPGKAIKDHVDQEDKFNNVSLSSLGQRGGWLINESGLYSMILSSKMKQAKAFKRWVTHEVLPSIHRTGGYVAAKPDDSPEEIMARAVLVAQETIERQKRQLDEMKPKAVFADAVATSKTSILIGDLAKILKQNGVDMGQRRLFEWMRQRGYLMRANGSSHNMPTQRSMERGWFEIKETSITHSDGHITVQRTPKVTGKGQQYFINLFLNGAA